MAVAAFDTLTVSRDLLQAGIQEKHAEAIALAVKQGQGDRLTKQDIALLKSDIDHFHLQSSSDHLRDEMKCGFDQLRSEIKSDMVWIMWTKGAILALSIGTVAMVISGLIALTPRCYEAGTQRNTCLR